MTDRPGRWEPLNGLSAEACEIRYGVMALDGVEPTAGAEGNVLATTWLRTFLG